MIKHIINLIKGLFTPKKEMDPHEELYLHTPEPEIPVHVEEKQEHCGSHLRYRKSCPDCIAIIGGK